MNDHIDSLRHFYNSKYYPILVALLIFLGHATGFEILFGAAVFLTVIPALMICHDLRFAILPFLCIIFTVSVKDYTPSDPGYADRYLNAPTIISIAVVLILFLVALVCFIVRNRKMANAFPKKGMFWSMLIFCAAAVLNGLFSADYTFKNILYTFALIASLLAVYALFVLFVQFDRSSFDYFMYCLVISGLLIVAELIFAFFTTVQFENGQIVKGSVVLGWGVWTNIGGMLSMLMPACFYFAYSHKRGWIGFLLGMVEYACIILSQSRGALLVGTLILALCLVYLCLRGENRKLNRIFTLGIAVCGVVGVILFSGKLIALVQNFMELGFADNGRFEMWSIGFENFLENPVFGSGFYDSYQTEEWDMGAYPYLYHNTVIQLLGATGLVGTLAYAYHRFRTVQLTVTKPNYRKTFLATCILALLLFSLTDVLFFKTYPTIYYALMLLFMEQSGEETTGFM